MKNLTTKQIEQAQDLIEKFGFCTLETQKELAEAGFFEKIECNFGIIISKHIDDHPLSCVKNTSAMREVYNFIPIPQMGEVWKALPNIIKDKFANNCYKSLSSYYIYYTGSEYHKIEVQYSGNANKNDDINETEAMCRLWLKLHKENLL